MPGVYIGRTIITRLPLAGIPAVHRFEEFRMPFEVGSLRLRQEPVSAEVVSLGFEMEFIPVLPPIGTPDPEVEARVLLRVLIGLRLLTDGIYAQARLVRFEGPPCPGASAGSIGEVFDEDLLTEDFPGLRGVVLPEVRPAPETAVEEIVSAPEMLLVIRAVAGPGASRS
jgi:hypothetical protein